MFTRQIKEGNYVHWVYVSAILLAIFFFSGCASVTQYSLGKKTFDYNIPPQIKLEGVKTIAVLSPRTDASQIFQAKLMEGLQGLNVNIIDTQQLIGIVQERKLKPNAEDLYQFGEKTNVDLFLVAEVIGPDITAFKVIEKDGRVSLARFIKGRSDAERVKNIVEIFSGYKRSFEDEIGYIFPPDDKNKDEIIALHNEGKYQEIENRMKQILTAANPPLSKSGEVFYHFNLANLYEAQNRFGDALKEIEEAERINSGISFLETKIQPEVFLKAKNLVKSMMDTERNSKAASGALVGYKQDASNIAVLEFDTKGISDKSVGWLAAVYISTRLTQSNFNVYDRDYFLSLIQAESTLSEKEQGELLRVDKLVYGKFLKKTQVVKNPIYKEETVHIYRPKDKGGSYDTVVTKLDKTLVTYGLEIQGRVTDTKTAFGKFQTVSKLPITIEYPEGKGVPASDRDVEAEWEVNLYDQLVLWIEKTLEK
jgi:tetratricopeptide (TPR) repeat protein